MYKVSELIPEIEKISKEYTENIKTFTESMTFRAGVSKPRDTTLSPKKKDSLYTSVLEAFDKQETSKILETAIDNTRGTLQTLDSKKKDFQLRTKVLNKHEIALHKKFVLGIACIILFFVGAPLGAIIRKGGMGLPMVVAIVLFLTYHFIGIFTENSAEDGTMHPFLASWLSTFIMLPLGVWLTYRATTDQGVFDMDAFFQRFKIFNKKKNEPQTEGHPIILTQHEKALVLSRNAEQLIDIVKNHKQYKYSEDVRRAAIRELKKKGYKDKDIPE